ncbi:MAG: hypothetical protein LBJ57_07425 [Prevotellaceae bacterium]|jgi:hypothetical protein|nr:hypothetical protein [Prevotellaceae bacterium]
MKKKYLLSMLAFGAILISASCTKEDPAKPIDPSSYTAAAEKQATISGKLLIVSNISESQASWIYSALPGITIMATVSYSSLGFDDMEGAFAVSTQTNSNGEFTLKVPATTSGVRVSLTVNDTKGTQRQSIGAAGMISGKWSFSFSDQSVRSGQEVIIPAVSGTFQKDSSVGDLVY